MKPNKTKATWLLLCLATATLTSSPISADKSSIEKGGLISEIDFSTIPTDTSFIGSGILLAGEVTTEGNLLVGSNIEAVGLICGSAGCVGDPTLPIIKEALVTFEVPSGIPGGQALDASVWVTRELNSVIYDLDDIVVLSGNQIILDPGSYIVSSVQVFTAGLETIKSIQGRLRNVTENTTAALSLVSRLDAPQSTTQHADVVMPPTVFTIESLAGFELQYFVETANASNNALGRPVSSGENERYAFVHIKKISP